MNILALQQPKDQLQSTGSIIVRMAMRQAATHQMCGIFNLDSKEGCSSYPTCGCLLTKMVELACDVVYELLTHKLLILQHEENMSS